MTDKTAADYEQDAEQARARVADTAESIRNRMSPGQLIDEFSGLFTGGDGETALTNLKMQVRDNPLPLALIGLGVAWLMMGQGSSNSARQTSVSNPTTSNWNAGARLQDDYEGRTNYDEDDERGDTGAISGKAAVFGETAVQAAGSVRGIVSDTMNIASSAVGGAAQRAADMATSATSNAGQGTWQMQNAASDLIHREPLVVAALGVVVGAAIGMLLPGTKLENQQLGSMSTKLRDTAEDMFKKGVEGAKEVAAEAYETVKEEADHQGLKADGSLTEKIGEVVKKTAARAEETVREKIGTSLPE